MRLGIQLCVMRAAGPKHIHLILQMLRISTSAVSAQTSNGRGPGLTHDLQGHGFVVCAWRELLPFWRRDCAAPGQIRPRCAKLRESQLISKESQRVRPWTHTCHSQMLGILLNDLGGPLGPYCTPPRLQCVISFVLEGHVILTPVRLICHLKLRIVRKRVPLPR